MYTHFQSLLLSVVQLVNNIANIVSTMRIESLKVVLLVSSSCRFTGFPFLPELYDLRESKFHFFEIVRFFKNNFELFLKNSQTPLFPSC